MFTQTDNPFGEIMPIYHSPLILESTYSDSPSSVWKWILAIFSLLGGLIIFLVWNEKNKEDKKELEDKNKSFETQNLDEMNS